ncbi:hypothetical protein ABZ671_27450 [Micromonospora sp. NPDC006766]|uniref:hypothetical protein n=1 Tax=Micromonospora sp. NPDC006766 TaxID=3154778 RepID=UPI0033EBB7E0
MGSTRGGTCRRAAVATAAGNNLVARREAMKRALLRRLAVPAALLLAFAPTGAGSTATAQSVAATYSYRLLAKAQPDECFAGVGVPYPVGPPCATGQPKVNQAYVWGMTKVSTKIWFGTGANVHCVVGGATLALAQPILNDDYVCEYGESQIIVQNPTVPASVGDQRRPEVFIWDTATQTLTRKTDDIMNASAADQLRLRATLGLRAAGSFNGVVLFGGPGLGTSINMFAFNSTTGQYLGSAGFQQYGNIRHFLVAGNALYAGVGVGRNGELSGNVLRWTGSVTDPFNFVNVGTLPAQAADLAIYDGRIAVSTWSTINADTPAKRAGIWVSPILANGQPGLNEEDANGWQQVWEVGQYDPDLTVASSYGLGGLYEYGGQLYWSTMHVPLKSSSVFLLRYPQPDDTAKCNAIYNTLRAISVWRGSGLGTSTAHVDMLYGESTMKKYDPAGNKGVGSWSDQPTGWTAVYGRSGFGGNPFLNYGWVMREASGKLFIGVMDWAYLLKGRLGSSTCGHKFGDYDNWGGELWVFEDPNRPATPVNTTGFGNILNYGVRTMVTDGNKLYLGMANPMNLRTDRTQSTGGWELIELTIG